MLVNADLSLRASLTPDAYHWVPSPQVGVERVMLDRVGGEVARATSIVRYAPQSHFPSHQHPGGEEILVLSGTFSDETRSYPAGWYLRNPPGSSHQPFSAEGTTIFVKLWQMPTSEPAEVRIDTRDPTNWAQAGDRWVCWLFDNGVETVQLQRLVSGQTVATAEGRQAELLVLDGVLMEGGQVYESGSWLRFPARLHPVLSAGSRAATVYVKTTHIQGATP